MLCCYKKLLRNAWGAGSKHRDLRFSCSQGGGEQDPGEAQQPSWAAGAGSSRCTQEQPAHFESCSFALSSCTPSPGKYDSTFWPQGLNPLNDSDSGKLIGFEECEPGIKSGENWLPLIAQGTRAIWLPGCFPLPWEQHYVASPSWGQRFCLQSSSNSLECVLDLRAPATFWFHFIFIWLCLENRAHCREHSHWPPCTLWNVRRARPLS